MFDRWGTIVTRHRWTTVVIVVGLTLVSGLWGAGVFGALSQGGYEDPTSEAVGAAEVAAAAGATSSADIIAVYTPTDGQSLGTPAVAEAVTSRLADLPAEEVSFVASYWQTQDPTLASADGRSALALITLAGDDSTAKQEAFDVVEPMLEVDGVPTQLAGAVPLEAAVSDQTKSDLLLAEMVSLPIVLVLLLVIFGSVVAALLPVAVGLLSILASLGVLHALATFTTVSEFAVNVASLLGLGMAIDYGLFVVSRYREELALGATPADAVRRTLGTAGR
ncbi:MAG: MMPL family transporter, partial [Jiangellaceae bacterium]